MIDPKNPGHYVQGVWTPNFINETGLWVPGSEVGSVSVCLDCNATYKDGWYDGACREAGCPTPPPSKYALCTDRTTKEDCKVCDEAGNVCVGSECLDCYAKENARKCGLTGCGPFCNGALPDGTCRTCSQDGKKVCAGLPPKCQDCTNPQGHFAKQDCQLSGCCEPGTPGCCVGKPNCSGCDAGRTCVLNRCIDCNAIQNYKACAAAGCSGLHQPSRTFRQARLPAKWVL